MKVVAITGKQKCELVEKPDPKPKDNIVVVKVHVAPMCTEYKMYKEGQVSNNLGHEAVGEVAEADPSSRVKVGDRVAVMPLDACGKCSLCASGDYIYCKNRPDVLSKTGSEAGRATYAQYLIKQEHLLVPLPDDISYEHGGMSCCGLGPTFGAVRRMKTDASHTVLITGMGPVGLGGVINATYAGSRVIAVEMHPHRRKLAKELGAAEALDPNDDALSAILDLTGGLGADKTIDCSGAVPAQRLAIEATRRRGEVAFVGEAGPLEIKVSNDMIRNGLSLLGVWHWNLTDTDQMIQLIRDSGEKLDKLITHTFPMSRTQDAFELQMTGECGKVLLNPWQ